jgi:parallel beta-helix repeat protein
MPQSLSIPSRQNSFPILKLRARFHRIILLIKLTILILLLFHTQAGAVDIIVTNVTELTTAINNIAPGQRILLAPGTYVLSQRFVLDASKSGTALNPVSIGSRDGLGTVTIDADGNEEAFLLTGVTFFTFEGLRITGGAYHAIKVDAPSTDILIQNNALFDNTRGTDLDSQASAIKGGGSAPVGGIYASRVTIQNNEIFQLAPFAGTNFQGIDCNACKSWIIRNNFIHDIRAATLTGTGIQFKSGSADTVIENNVVRNSGLVGINYGGFGTPSWGGELFEHVRGIVRNNIVTDTADAGISVINTRDGKVYNNTLYNNGFTPDVRVAAVNLEYRNNILDRALNLRDGTTATQSNNLVLSTPTDSSLFVNAAGNDFHLNPTASTAIDQGFSLSADVPTDFEGTTRPQGNGFDIGADELGSVSPTPTPTPTPPPGPVPTPTAWGIQGDIPAPGDYDGDRKADFAVWRTTEGILYILLNADKSILIQFWGIFGDIPVPDDYDGDGKTDFAVFRPSNGTWYILNSLMGPLPKKFGKFSDTPIPDDFDGDGLADLAIFRSTIGGWGIKPSGGGKIIKVQWGLIGDKPVPRDYDGDGLADIVVWRGVEGNWYLNFSSGGSQIIQWGLPGDNPVPADYDGDGKTDIAVWRGSEGNWYLQLSTSGNRVINLGQNGDIPVPEDYNGDGKADLAVWRGSEGNWYIQFSQ